MHWLSIGRPIWQIWYNQIFIINNHEKNYKIKKKTLRFSHTINNTTFWNQIILMWTPSSWWKSLLSNYLNGIKGTLKKTDSTDFRGSFSTISMKFYLFVVDINTQFLCYQHFRLWISETQIVWYVLYSVFVRVFFYSYQKHQITPMSPHTVWLQKYKSGENCISI